MFIFLKYLEKVSTIIGRDLQLALLVYHIGCTWL